MILRLSIVVKIRVPFSKSINIAENYFISIGVFDSNGKEITSIWTAIKLTLRNGITLTADNQTIGLTQTPNIRFDLKLPFASP